MGPNPIRLVSYWIRGGDTHTQREGHVRTQEETVICKPRTKVSGETDPYLTPGPWIFSL